jgi:dihydrofolate synthase/folylpolyglutamate synthase
MIFQDETGLLDLPRPNLPGDHQIDNAGMALAALRHLGLDGAACEAAVSRAEWPARMQRLREGPLAALARDAGAELWLDGGHNPAAGEALSRHLKALPPRPTFLICGMLNTKDVTGYLRPLLQQADALVAVSIPGEANTLAAGDTAGHAARLGTPSSTAETVTDALKDILTKSPNARVLICGSLYLAGSVLRDAA